MKIELIFKKFLGLIRGGVKFYSDFRHRYDSFKCCANCKYKRRGQIAFLPVVCGCANHKRMFKQHKNIIIGLDREPSTTESCDYWKPDYFTSMEHTNKFIRGLRCTNINVPQRKE